jgi:hypothetical protein
MPAQTRPNARSVDKIIFLPRREMGDREATQLRAGEHHGCLYRIMPLVRTIYSQVVLFSGR